MTRNNDETVPKVKSKEGMLIVRWLYRHGFPEKRIAAAFDVNQGRIAEIIRRK